MKIDAVNFFNTLDIQKNNQVNNNVNFGDYLQKAIDNINDKQIQAEEATQQLISGDTQDIHEVMLSTEEARLSLELAVQIRNKIVDAYQEISRMQI